MQHLDGKTAFITGATSGIGLAIAERLARAGARIAVHGIAGADEGAAICERLRTQFDTEARYFAADLRDVAALESSVAQAQQAFGGIDVLVNNAGMQHVSPVESFPTQMWNDMLAVNLSAAFHTVRLCLPGMRARDWGRIVNIASISGLRGRAGKSAYNATKHGLIGFTKSVALETATTGITCNAICPGWALTPIVQKQVDALAQRENLDNATAVHKLVSLRQPSGKLVTVEQLAALAGFLCSPEADEVRGAAWTMDGGTTAA